MLEKNSKSKKFIDCLLNFQDVKDLELCDDQGVKVSTHTYDVLTRPQPDHAVPQPGHRREPRARRLHP